MLHATCMLLFMFTAHPHERCIDRFAMLTTFTTHGGPCSVHATLMCMQHWCPLPHKGYVDLLRPLPGFFFFFFFAEKQEGVVYDIKTSKWQLLLHFYPWHCVYLLHWKTWSVLGMRLPSHMSLIKLHCHVDISIWQKFKLIIIDQENLVRAFQKLKVVDVGGVWSFLHTFFKVLAN